MDFDRLRYLVAVSRAGSVRGAATAMSLTPGAVSKALQRLEQEVGATLLQQDGRGVTLTDDGRWLAERALHLVGDHAALVHDFLSRGSKSTFFCIATYDAFAAMLPALVTSQFLPNVPLSLRERWPGEVEEAIATQLSDVGVTFTPIPHETVDHVEIANIEMGIYIGTKSGLEALGLRELPFAIAWHPVKGTAGTYGPLDGWPSDGPPRRVQFKSSSLESRIELCRRGHAAIALPKFVAERHNLRVRASEKLVQLPVKPTRGSWRRRVYLVKRQGAPQEIELRSTALGAAVRALCND